jgi:Chaperone of endosialidase
MNRVTRMNGMTKLSLHVAALLVGAGAAHAAQPPDPVTSDGSYNTAVGLYALLSENGGALNTAIGYESLFNNSSGGNNTALGASALWGNTSGAGNTASGNYALHLNQTGSQNTADGAYAMYMNKTGSYNTATGLHALYNSTSSYNTALGNSALYTNTVGISNTAVGFQASNFNLDASRNTAVGTYSLVDNAHGGDNVAIGYQALYGGESSSNVAIGVQALYQNAGGAGNVAIGVGSMIENFTGSNNIAIGNDAGVFITTSNNIVIGSPGVSGDSGVIRIGNTGSQTSAYMAGISNSKITGSAVFVTSSGQLGVLASSERYKTAIASMGGNTEKLQQLRPVTFHLKNDPAGAVQYGLIAEEVDKVYPELVIRDDKGIIQGVRYDELAPMLLNEIQQEKAQMREMQAQLASLKQSNDVLQAAMRQMLDKDRRVAMR